MTEQNNYAPTTATTFTTGVPQVNYDSDPPVLDDEPALPAQPDCDLTDDERGAE